VMMMMISLLRFVHLLHTLKFESIIITDSLIDIVVK